MCCCGLCKEETFLKLAIIGVVIIDIMLCLACLTTIYLCMFGTDESHFLQSYVENHTEDVLNEVEVFVVLLLMPIMVMVFIKTYYGLRWMCLKYTRSSYQTYYLISMSTYASYVI